MFYLVAPFKLCFPLDETSFFIVRFLPAALKIYV